MAATSSPAWIGKELNDRYKIRKELGKAVGRRTLLADDMQETCPVVIKILTFDSDFEWTNLRLFEREGEVLKSLTHEGIPNYLDYFEIDLPHAKGYALVQSYIDGQSLQEHVEAGRRFSEADVIDLAQRLLAILQYLHNQMPPIIHRDLKPSNILLGDRSAHSQGALYLVDFGSVQVPLLNASGTLTIVGSYGYMPPEQFGGRAEPASDLYSLGATLIFLMTGCHPADLPQKQMRIQFEAKAKHISLPMRHWLRWLTNPDISQRPSSAKDALDGLQTIVDRGTFSPLVNHPLAQSRILINQQDDKLDIVIPAKGFRHNKAGSWLDLSVLAITFSIASSLLGGVSWIVYPLFFGVALAWAWPVIWLLSSIISILSGFAGITFLPTPARKHLLDQVHIYLNDNQLLIYRETLALLRSRKTLFKAKPDNITKLYLDTSTPAFEIYAANNYCRLKSEDLGLTQREFNWIVQELSERLSISL